MKVLRITGTVVLSAVILLFISQIIHVLLNNHFRSAMWGVAVIIGCIAGIAKIWRPKDESNE